ncbi:MAG: 4-hydroxy-tetrahydrodipicolinate reductase [Lachnospiraceae bacterium]|nr:4-hydroxy-tetrahydrodipicolinate reductase [Lachnospiraceae bacterium]
MINIIMNGCNGKMGQTIVNLLALDEKIKIAAGIDAFDEGKNSFPVFEKINDCDVFADVIIDFSTASACDLLLDYCVAKQIPCVFCTTGLSKEQLDKLNEAAGKVAILKSANMSLGINLLLKMLKEAANILAPAGFDIEIAEKHHNQKVDAPSGTALALGDALNEDLNYDYVFDRSQKIRKKEEIGFSVVRGGNIVGEHDIIFAGTDEIVTFSHTAYSRAVFAKGAIEAAKFLAGKPAGLYSMADVIG